MTVSLRIVQWCEELPRAIDIAVIGCPQSSGAVAHAVLQQMAFRPKLIAVPVSPVVPRGFVYFPYVAALNGHCEHVSVAP